MIGPGRISALEDTLHKRALGQREEGSHIPWMSSGRMSAMYRRSDAAALLPESSQTSPHTAATSASSSDFAMNAVGIAWRNGQHIAHHEPGRSTGHRTRS